jgi:predicted TIM-barrel fold metal-dependent hydrolase
MFGGIPDQFPRLRFGFIEAAAQWVPYLIIDLRRRLEREGKRALSESPLRDNRVYVACQTNDDIPYIMQYVGEDNLVIGSDYGHSDTSSELEALRNFQHSGGLSSGVVRKILEDNPRALYGL